MNLLTVAVVCLFVVVCAILYLLHRLWRKYNEFEDWCLGEFRDIWNDGVEGGLHGNHR